MKGQEPVQKRDLARRDGLPGDIAAPESLGEHQRETVLLIHGTFANKVVSPPAWWHPGSDFCHKLDLSLSQQGSPARCWAHIGSSTNPTNVFAWTGGNLESERHIGGDSLAKEILDLETNYDVSRYHIVAHSHGGNVVLHALRSLADDPKNLGAVIFLGTPVLLFSLRASWLTRSAVALLFCGVGLVSSIAAAVLGGESRLRSVLLVGVYNSLRNSLFFAGEFPTLSILMAIGFGSLLLVEWWNRPRRQLPIYGSGHAHAFEFAPDEAMKALQLSLGFAQRPGDVLEQLFSTKAPPEYAVDPPRPEFRMKGLWSDFKKTAPFLRGRNVQKLTAILACIFVVLAVFSELPVVLVANLIYRTKERPYLLNLIEIIQKLLVDMFFALELPFGFIFTLALMLMFFRLYLSDVFKFAWLSIARAFQLFLRGPGAWIMGAVVRNYAVGGQCKMVLRPPELPERKSARAGRLSATS